MLRLDFSLSKRHLGILTLLLGCTASFVIFGFDALGLSDPHAGFGPSQRLGLGLAIAFIILGLSLIPLGDAPA